MSIISKLKGAKKAADDHKAKTTQAEEKKPAAAPYRHVPTHAATDALTSAPGNWKADEIKQQNLARLSRIGSDYSTRPATSHTTSSRPARPGFNRALSDSSLDFTPGTSSTVPSRSPGSSLKSNSRHSSFQGLEKVPEDNRNTTTPTTITNDTEPVFAPAMLANRSKTSRSPRGSTRSSLGKSPLSSVECSADSSPIESETSSEASGSFDGQIELRSEAVSYAPVVHDVHPGRKVNQMLPEQQPTRRYFAHAKPTTTEPKEIPTLDPIKKERFSFMKRSGGAVAAH